MTAERTVLVEPARKQVVELAADVLGRLASEQTPTALRPFARFTPARRRQRGAVQIAAALDTDDQFRDSVADAVRETLPDLVAAVADGELPAASDPVDVAVVAYLVRPQGWQDVLAAASELWRAQREHADELGEERARLQHEIAQLRGKLKSETARSRDAIAEAGAQARDRIAELEKALRNRTRELRAAERERNEARAELAAARQTAERADTAHESELRRLRARVSELEQAGGAARREARVERDVDDARLWLLVETVNSAAAGIRRELSLPPPSMRPADAVTADDGELSTARTVADAGALDRLLAMPEAHLIVDGYNVTMSGYGELTLADQRDRLIAALATLAARRGPEVTVVFDGRTRPAVQPRTPRGVRVLFSAADEIADDVIRALVAAEPFGRVLVVATSDQQVVVDVRRAGAWTVPSTGLLALLG
ncbi:MAG TPA: NYN domain-containing protein [Jatrophihabitantaceae bacterium]|nr:NYN domain-containing protein [Jatrophihabitantaceae bacterium]